MSSFVQGQFYPRSVVEKAEPRLQVLKRGKANGQEIEYLFSPDSGLYWVRGPMGERGHITYGCMGRNPFLQQINKVSGPTTVKDLLAPTWDFFQGSEKTDLKKHVDQLSLNPGLGTAIDPNVELQKLKKKPYDLGWFITRILPFVLIALYFAPWVTVVATAVTLVFLALFFWGVSPKKSVAPRPLPKASEAPRPKTPRKR